MTKKNLPVLNVWLLKRDFAAPIKKWGLFPQPLESALAFVNALDPWLLCVDYHKLSDTPQLNNTYLNNTYLLPHVSGGQTLK